jgi:tRNA(His) guanylyltransferase
MFTEFDKRMKSYEKSETMRKFINGFPVIVRLDGKNFSKFTSGLKKPFDVDFSTVMINVLNKLVEEYNCIVGYTQSDEITLIFEENNEEKELIYGNRKHKFLSLISSKTTALFNWYKDKYLLNKQNQLAIFDCRCFQVPNRMEAINNLIWREQDALRNSIISIARMHYSHTQLHKKNQKNMIDMILNKNDHVDNYPYYLRRGTYIKKYKIIKKLTNDEIDQLPSKHHARINPNLEFERTIIKKILNKKNEKLVDVENKINFIFENEFPIFKNK